MNLLVFDLDGTLIDSKLDLVHSVNAMRIMMNLPAIGEEIVASYVGNGAPVLVRRALGKEASDADAQRALEYFLAYYHDHMLDNTRLYPGVREALDRMRAAGSKMAVLTNKPVRFSRQILDGLGLAPYFRYIYGGNSFENKKPNPAGMGVLLRDFGAAPKQAMLVGDSEVDVQTARNAGTWCCCVTYGLGSDKLSSNPPDLLVGSLTELAACLDRQAAMPRRR